MQTNWTQFQLASYVALAELERSEPIRVSWSISTFSQLDVARAWSSQIRLVGEQQSSKACRIRRAPRWVAYIGPYPELTSFWTCELCGLIDWMNFKVERYFFEKLVTQPAYRLVCTIERCQPIDLALDFNCYFKLQRANLRGIWTLSSFMTQPRVFLKAPKINNKNIKLHTYDCQQRFTHNFNLSCTFKTTCTRSTIK
jgi:hypothetical protein